MSRKVLFLLLKHLFIHLFCLKEVLHPLVYSANGHVVQDWIRPKLRIRKSDGLLSVGRRARGIEASCAAFPGRVSGSWGERIARARTGTLVENAYITSEKLIHFATIPAP